MAKNIVLLNGITKNYGKGDVVVHALRGIDMTINAGEFAAVAGPSGSGKSTLLNIIGGLDKPSAGSVQVNKREITDLSPSELSRLRRDSIGFIFQSYNLIPVLSAEENTEYVLMLQGIPKKERKARVGQLLQDVGLGGMEDRLPKELSGGQQQRVAIARAIVSEPALVLADEPTANVDSDTAKALLELMQKLNEDKRITFLFSSHDHEVMNKSKRIIILKDGKIYSDGKPTNTEN